ncbi:hypothetical protein [Desulfomonile tiedjei]|uniref:Uncharacterized protein n=1 Tax=Desulfomonile tiedjei (strain ATCC 49306 / DSM 6799 / DCB-1) TaxID=706587 RepID=I4CCM5_DESTA|nr:hypothetical protein [Desulfomonile tiedjei]AFM27316.1 hypothetical protein Desti_4695 [Desulfomonile tiedjei DSM 6799]
MKKKILVLLMILSLSYPAASHAFGILRYTFDAIANQLGLDRGPVPKVFPQLPPTGFDAHGKPLSNHPDANRIYIQAEGF